MLNKFHLSLHGIKCHHCLATVEQALQKASGVEKVEIDQDSKSASVESYTSVESLISAVKAVGYDASVVHSTKEVLS
jgi:copper chaperone CopZ